MIDQLMEERKDAVGYLERQGVGRITRTMKRVWERATRVEVIGGARRDARKGCESSDPPARNARGRNSRGKVRAAAHLGQNEGNTNDPDNQVDLLDYIGLSRYADC